MRLFLSLSMLLMLYGNLVLANEIEAKAQSITERFLSTTGIPSVSYSFFNQNGEIYSHAAGLKDVKSNRLASTSTIYDVGSNAKIITAVSILQLVDKELIELDEPASRYLPFELPALRNQTSDPILVHHLLNHLSGIPSQAWFSSIWRPSEFQQKESIYKNIRLNHKPGQKYQYCNVCFLIATEIIENISGFSFEDYVVRNILEPAGVSNRGFLSATPEMYSNLALPYNMRFGIAYPTDFHVSGTPGAGGSWFTSEQLAKVLHYIFASEQGKGAISKKAFSKLVNQYSDIAGYNGGYGLGVGLERFESGVYPFHQGSMPGFISHYLVDQKTGGGLVLSANVSASTDVEEQTLWLRDQLFSLIAPSFISPNANYSVERKPPLKEADLANLPSPEGTYFSENPDLKVSILRFGNELIFENPSQKRFSLARISHDEFVLTTSSERIRIVFSNKQPASLHLLNGSGKELLKFKAN